MARPNNDIEALAREAADRIEAVRNSGQQLGLPLPDELPTPEGEAGRPARGKGRAKIMLRDWLAHRGLKMPEAALADIAGLASRDDVFAWAMARTEQVLAWAEAGAVPIKGAPAVQSMGARLDMFKFVFTAALRAAEALLPYGLAKLTPDAAPVQAVQIVMPGAAAPAAGPDRARDVTPKPSRMAPPPMPHEMQQNQELEQITLANSDGEIRTEGA